VLIEVECYFLARFPHGCVLQIGVSHFLTPSRQCYVPAPWITFKFRPAYQQEFGRFGGGNAEQDGDRCSHQAHINRLRNLPSCSEPTAHAQYERICQRKLEVHCTVLRSAPSLRNRGRAGKPGGDHLSRHASECSFREGAHRYPC
jgi:hypothetical protein